MAIRKILAVVLLLWGALSLLPLSVRPLEVGDDTFITYPKTTPADLLLLQLRQTDASPQWRRGALTVDSTAARVDFWILSDVRPHWLLLPVGTLPFGDSDGGLRVTVFHGGGAPPEVLRAFHIRRAAWAFDVLWLQVLTFAGVDISQWGAFWLSALLLWSALLFAVLRQLRGWLRAAWLLHLFWSIVAVWLGARALLTGYLPQSERAAAQNLPAYNHPQDWQHALLRAAEQLPDAPVLLYSPDPEGYLVFRARYLLYPRRVDALTFVPNSADLAQRLQRGGYGAWMMPTKAGVPPLAGWRDLSVADDALRVWASPADALPYRVVRAEGWLAWLRAGLFLAAVAVFGALLAGALGADGLYAWGAGWLLGWLAVAIWLFVLHLAHIRWTVGTLVVPLLLGLVVLWRRFGLPRLPRRMVWIGLGGLLWLIPLAVALPFGDQDTWTMWGFKGMAFFADGDLLPVLRLYASADLHHAGYPPFVPLSQVGVYLAAGGFSERLAKLLPPVSFVLLLGLLYAEVARVRSGRVALGWVAVLAVTPLLLDHAALSHADLLLAFALLVQGIALQRLIEGGARQNVWLAAGAASVAAWLRPDGVFLAAALWLAAMWIGRERGGWRMWGAPLLMFGLMFAVWRVYAQANGLLLAGSGTFTAAGGFVRLGAGLRELAVTLLLNQRNSAWGFMGGGYGALWVLTGGAVLLGWRGISKNRGVQFLGLALFLGMGMYVGVYILREFYSMERYLLHFAPLAVLLAGQTEKIRLDEGIAFI
ncbi:MAG: hypothetical protein OHK0052_25740 [Anaerolineales bacterium]